MAVSDLQLNLRFSSQIRRHFSCVQNPSSPSSMLTIEDQEMLQDASKRKKTPGISKGQEFDTAKTRLSKHHRLTKSSSQSPIGETRKDPFPIRRPSSVPLIDFDIDRIKALEVIDRVDTIRSLQQYQHEDQDAEAEVCACENRKGSNQMKIFHVGEMCLGSWWERFCQ